MSKVTCTIRRKEKNVQITRDHIKPTYLTAIIIMPGSFSFFSFQKTSEIIPHLFFKKLFFRRLNLIIILLNSVRHLNGDTSKFNNNSFDVKLCLIFSQTAQYWVVPKELSKNNFLVEISIDSVELCSCDENLHSFFS